MMKMYCVSFNLKNVGFVGEYKTKKVNAQSVIDAVAIVQKEMIDEGKNPQDYIYAGVCESVLYVCEGVPQ